MNARLVPVSEFVEGETVEGRIFHCPGPAGLWPCGFELGHPGDHLRLENAEEGAFNAYLFESLNAVLPKVRAIVAERDALLAIVQGAGKRGVVLGAPTYEALVEFLEDRADMKDSPDGPVPDSAMGLLMAIREARR